MAMNAIKRAMQVLLILALIAELPSLIGQVVMLRSGVEEVYMDMVDLLLEEPAAEEKPVLPETSGESGSQQEGSEAADVTQTPPVQDAAGEKNAALEDMITPEMQVMVYGVMAVQLLLVPGLMLLLNGGLQDAVRGREVTLAAGLARLRHVPKALLLNLWMVLRVWAWMLPGMAAALLGALVVKIDWLFTILTSGGMIVMLVLGSRAYLHYHLAPMALADQPELSLNGCIRASWSVMRNRKLERFMLYVSFAGWMLLYYMLSGMLTGMFGSVIGLALSMMVELMLMIYMGAAEACFYLVYAKGKEMLDKARAEEDADPLA